MKSPFVILFLVGYFFRVNVLGHAFEEELAHFINGETFESVIHPGDGEFLMKLFVGTPPTITYATLDTGSDLTWIQCMPCISCFTQNTSLFDPKKSTTYQNLSCHSPPCQSFPKNNASIPSCSVPSEQCQFFLTYADTSCTVGFLATEKFAFQMVNGSLTKVDLVFGCGHDNRMPIPDGGSGIIGLGRGPLSLTSQLGLKVEKMFSYCFPKSAEFSSMFRFGSSAMASISATGKVVSTPLLSHEMYPHLYFITLEGISLGAKKLESKRVILDKRNTVIDSGTTLTYLEPELCENVVSSLKEFIGLEPVDDSSHTYSLCYPTKSFCKLTKEQSVIFHFTGADIELKTVNMFVAVGNMTCFSMLPSNLDFNVYGNVAQKDFEVGYNLESNVLSFAPANCSQFPWKNEAGISAYNFSSLPVFLCIIGLVHIINLLIWKF